MLSIVDLKAFLEINKSLYDAQGDAAATAPHGQPQGLEALFRMLTGAKGPAIAPVAAGSDR